MPDTTTLEMPGDSGGGGQSIPGWVMIVGAVAGIAGLVLLLKGSGGGGTTAAGTSINAALGSIQEENMNLLGTTQAGFMQGEQTAASNFTSLSGILSSGFGGVNSAISSDQQQNQANFTALGSQLASMENDLTHQMAGYSADSQASFNNLSALVQTGQATQAQWNAATSSLLGNIQSDVQSGIVSQNSANNVLDNINTFLLWQFYQIPGRYSAFIPSPLLAPGTMATPASSTVNGTF